MYRPEALRPKGQSLSFFSCLRSVFRIKTGVQALYIAVIFATVIISTFVFMRVSMSSGSQDTGAFAGVNSSDISSYFIPKTKNSGFHYPEIYSKNESCIDRSQYSKDFLRLFGFPPKSSTENDSYVIVFGAETSVGMSVVKELQKRKIKCIKFPGAGTFGVFGHSKSLFTSKEIIGAIVADHPFIAQKTRLYYKGICEFMSSFQKPYVIMVRPPYNPDLIDSLNFFEARVVFVPLFLDTDTYDLNNPLIRARLDCEKVNKTMFQSDVEFSLLKPKVIAKTLVDQLFDIDPHPITLTSGTKGSLEDAIKMVAKQYQHCKAVEHFDTPTQSSIPQPVVIGKPKNNFESVLRKAITKIPTYNYTDPYVTIVTYGNNTGMHEDLQTMQGFLDYSAFALKDNPLAKVDFIIVDMTEKFDPLSAALKLDDTFKGRLKYISYPKLENKPISVFSALNIGIKRAKGKFVLACSMSDILSTEFYQEITPQLLDMRILYSASIWITEQLQQIPKGFTFRSLSESKFAGELCRLQMMGLSLTYDVNNALQEWSCGQLNFILCSKEFWNEMGGLPEFPIEYDFDLNTIVKMRFMRMFPGIMQAAIRVPVLHVIKEHDDKPSSPLDIEKTIQEYACTGYSSEVQPFENSEWGYPNMKIQENLK